MAQATLTLHDAEDEVFVADPPAPRRRGLLRWVAAALLLTAVGGWFAPAVIGRSGLRHRLVHAVVPAYPGMATVGGASLGWAQPVVLRDVVLSDTKGGELVRVGEVKTSRSLAGLLFARGKDLGTVTFTRPEMTVRLRAGGSNLVDTLAPVLAEEGSGSGLKIVVEQGRVGWTGIDGSASKAAVENVTVVVVQPAGASMPERVEVDGRLTDGETGGEFSASLMPAKGETPPEISVAATEVPLGALQPWLDRFGVAVGVLGKASVDLVGSVKADGGVAWNADGRVEGRRVWVTWPAVLGEETLEIDSAVLTGKASGTGGAVALDGVELQSEIGTVTATGRFATSFDSGDGWEERLSAVLEQDAVVTASLDLARVASSLERALKLRSPIESGRLEAEIRTVAAESGREGTVRVRTTDLVAGLAERRVVWKEPLSADVTVRRAAEGITVERLQVESEGVALAGSGSLSECEATFEADLDRLRGQLARLVELPEGSLTGRASGRVTARRLEGETGRVRIDATAGVRGLSLAMGSARWVERDLSLAGAAEVGLDELRLAAVESGSVSLRSVEGDELTAALTGPVRDISAAEWPLEVTLKGELGRWAARSAMWGVPVLPGGWSASGGIDASASVGYSPAAVSVSGLSGEISNLRVVSPEQTFEEPYVRLVGGGRWSAADNLLVLSSATLTSESVSVKATDVRLPLAGDRPASGSIRFRGGAGRLARYVLPAKPPVWLSGVVGGMVELESSASVTSAEARIAFEKPVLSRPVTAVDGSRAWRPVWSDEKATAVVVGRYDHAGDRLELETLSLAATGMSLEASGDVKQVASIALADINGAIECDLEAFAKRITTGLPDGVSARGRSKRPFAVRGPLFAGGGVSPELAASGGFGWEEVRAFGLTVGAGQIAGTLKGRELQFEPFDWPIAGGRLRGTAAVSLGDVPVLTVAPGRVAEDIHLTPELCRTWLRYAAPSLADAAEVQGTASLDVQACRVPVLDPARAEAAGVLVVKEAEATPGPLARSVLDAVRQVQMIAGRDATNGSDLRLVVPAQDVKLTVTGGRVFHDRFAVRLADEGGAVVATSGSVGFDETLDLVAEVPLDAKWFKEERVASALTGQTLRVPIRGTLGGPAVDPRAFQDLARRAAAGAVNGLIDQQIEKQLGDPLKKLFGRD